jgi:hypothetical protein
MPKPTLIHFYGYDDGSYIESPKVLLEQDFDWTMIAGLAMRNDWKNYDVNGATEYHRNFRIALERITKERPELYGFEISFDGLPKLIRELINQSLPPEEIDWRSINFQHGTSTNVIRKIMDEGLNPRSETNSPAVYGADVESASPSNPDAVYLTTQRNAARFAARDAARILGGRPAVIHISDIYFDSDRLVPDPDSREQTAKMSLWRLGSIGYLGSVWGQIWDVEKI